MTFSKSIQKRIETQTGGKVTYIPPSTKTILVPKCPHCGMPFATWAAAKIHVKKCEAGPHPRRPRT